MTKIGKTTEYIHKIVIFRFCRPISAILTKLNRRTFLKYKLQSYFKRCQYVLNLCEGLIFPELFILFQEKSKYTPQGFPHLNFSMKYNPTGHGPYW